MDFRRTATAASLLSLLFGIGFVLMPTASGTVYSITGTEAATALLQRHFGSEVLMYAAATWGLRGLVDPAAQRRAASVQCAATLSGLAVTLHGTLGGTLNVLGWSSVVIYGFFVGAWGRLALGQGASSGTQPHPVSTRPGV